jgi:GNAT superfamily N-acetyltransferase
VSDINYRWKGDFTNSELNRLHAEAFDHRVYPDGEWDWVGLTERHSLGWVTARMGADLVGFVNVIWDGLVHAWIQDEMVAADYRHQGIGVGLIHLAKKEAKGAGCEWLHVDFDDDLRSFYFDAAGFKPTNAGLIDLTK